MPSTPSCLAYILDQLAPIAADIATRPMMGEYLLYCRGTLVGGIYDDRLLVKPTPAARHLLPTAPLEPPYPGARPLLLVDSLDTPGLLARLLPAIAADLSRSPRH